MRTLFFAPEIRNGFKIFTHDWRPPTMGGQPILRESAKLPITLPAVDLDTTADPYGAGYHYSPSLAGAARNLGILAKWSSRTMCVGRSE